IKLKKVIHQL
ncbi:hypothetical protein ACTFIW_002403, partial [Dictyostelium discoideum]